MNSTARTIIKYAISLGSAVGLLLFFRTLPAAGEDIFGQLTKFNVTAIVLGIINFVVFFVSMKQFKKNREAFSSIEKGSHAFLIAVALLALEFGGMGQAGVIMDQNNGPQEVSVSGCYIEEPAFINKVRGYDNVLVCTKPDGSETIFVVTDEMAEKVSDGADKLSIKYYGMTNRVIEIK